MKSNSDIALLLIRIGLGAVFIAHGLSKISNMNDTPGTISFFASVGLPVFFAYLVAYVELLGGLSMVLGIFTGWAGIALAIIMVVAIGLVKISKGFVGGYEFELVLFLSSLAISLAGPGSYALGNFRKKS